MDLQSAGIANRVSGFEGAAHGYVRLTVRVHGTTQLVCLRRPRNVTALLRMSEILQTA